MLGFLPSLCSTATLVPVLPHAQPEASDCAMYTAASMLHYPSAMSVADSRGSEADLFGGGNSGNGAGGTNSAAGVHPFAAAAAAASILPPGSAAGFGGASSHAAAALSLAQFPGLAHNMFPQVSAFAGNDAKKVKLDGSLGGMQNGGGFRPLPSPIAQSMGPGGATKVVLICNLPDQTSRSELCGIGAVHGKIVAASVVDHKNQGFLEYEEERAAMALVQRAAMNPPILRGQQLHIQFSNSKDMKSMVSSSAAAPGSHYLDMSPMNVGLQHGQGGGNPYMGSQSPNAGGPDSDMAMRNAMNMQSAAAAAAVANQQAMGNGDDRTVLRVIVEMGENTNIYNQVNLDVLHHLFSRTGTVLKIITFAKPGYPQQFQALIQYDLPKSAQTAKELFDGQNLYYGCCPLKVEYSKLTNLNVKFNNEKSKDFTRELPSGEGPAPNLAVLSDPNSINALAALAMLPQYSNPLGALGGQVNPFAPLQATGLNPAQSLPANMLLQQLRGAPGGQPSNNSVLLVGNLNTEKVTCDGLFTLFGVYGDVQRVKILFNKQDSALIQMAMESQANIAIEHLNEVMVYGKEMRVSLSKHQLVQMPKEGQPDAGLTRDYSNSPLHRFRKQGSKNYQNIYPPSCTLHLSNIAPGATEEQILDAFEKKNIEVVTFRFFPNDHKMALLQCRSKEEAIIALIEMHNYQLGENHHLRVSFSKTQMGMAGSVEPTVGPAEISNGPTSASIGGGGDGSPISL